MKNELEIRDEEILLLGLCRLNFSKDQSDKLLQLAGKVNDWGYFAAMANDHGIASLICDNIERLGLADLVSGFHRKVLFLLGDIFPTLTFMKNRYGCKSKMTASFHYVLRFGKIFWLVRK